MFSFKHFVKNYNKKFIALEVEEKSQRKLRQWCNDNNLNISKNYAQENIDPKDFYFHITLFYSNNKKYVQNGAFNIEPIKLTFSGIELLGPEHNIPTMLVHVTDELKNLRTVYEAAGLKDDWPEWKPHLTISYSWAGKPEIKTIDLPDFDVIVNRIIVKNQKGQ